MGRAAGLCSRNDRERCTLRSPSPTGTTTITTHARTQVREKLLQSPNSKSDAFVHTRTHIHAYTFISRAKKSRCGCKAKKGEEGRSQRRTAHTARSVAGLSVSQKSV